MSWSLALATERIALDAIDEATPAGGRKGEAGTWILGVTHRDHITMKGDLHAVPAVAEAAASPAKRIDFSCRHRGSPSLIKGYYAASGLAMLNMTV